MSMLRITKRRGWLYIPGIRLANLQWMGDITVKMLKYFPFLSFDRWNFAQIPSLPKFSDWRLSLPLWLGERTGNELVHFYQGENCSQVFCEFTYLSGKKIFMKIRWLTITEALKVQIWKRLTIAVQKRWSFCQFSMKVNTVSF